MGSLPEHRPEWKGGVGGEKNSIRGLETAQPKVGTVEKMCQRHDCSRGVGQGTSGQMTLLRLNSVASIF